MKYFLITAVMLNIIAGVLNIYAGKLLGFGNLAMAIAIICSIKGEM